MITSNLPAKVEAYSQRLFKKKPLLKTMPRCCLCDTSTYRYAYDNKALLPMLEYRPPGHGKTMHFSAQGLSHSAYLKKSEIVDYDTLVTLENVSRILQLQSERGKTFERSQKSLSQIGYTRLYTSAKTELRHTKFWNQ